MRGVFQRTIRNFTVLAGALIAMPWVLAAPAPTGDDVEALKLPTGGVLRVWEVRVTGAGDLSGEAPWFLAYSVSRGDRVTEGIVPGTEDAAPDRSPRLARDPRGGDIILVWSRWDGVEQKLASSNLRGDLWTDLHYLSFGRGDDLEPRLASGRDGAFVLWINDSRFFYAPLEIRAGRLLAAPRALRLPGASAPSTANGRIESPGSMTVDGGDSPVEPYNKSAPKAGPGKGGGGGASVWGVASQGDCARATLAVADADGSHLLIYRFTNGASRLVRRIDLPSPLPPRFAEVAATSDLATACRGEASPQSAR